MISIEFKKVVISSWWWGAWCAGRCYRAVGSFHASSRNPGSHKAQHQGIVPFLHKNYRSGQLEQSPSLFCFISESSVKVNKFSSLRFLNRIGKVFIAISGCIINIAQMTTG